jgi:TorA maturation chaperone TorD
LLQNISIIQVTYLKMNTLNVSQILMQAECYKILALFYYEPKGGVHNNRRLFDTLVKTSSLLDPKAFGMSKKLRKTGLKLDIEDLKREYSRLFAEPESALAYPCSSRYINKLKTDYDTIDWLSDFYKRTGYQPDLSALPSDHISTELGFVYHLLSNAANGIKDDDMSTISHFGELRCLFVREHVINWLPEFARCILHNSQSPFYMQLAILTRTIIVKCDEDGN